MVENFAKLFAQAYSPFPCECLGAPKFFRSAPNFPERPLKCISAYILYNKTYRVDCCEHFLMLSGAEPLLSQLIINELTRGLDV